MEKVTIREQYVATRAAVCAFAAGKLTQSMHVLEVIVKEMV